MRAGVEDARARVEYDMIHADTPEERDRQREILQLTNAQLRDAFEAKRPDRVRRQKVGDRETLSLDSLLDEDGDLTVPVVHRTADQKALAVALDSIIVEHLTPDQLEAVRLTLFEGESEPDAAAKLGVSHQAVHQRAGRAKKRLHKVLTEASGETGYRRVCAWLIQQGQSELARADT